MSRQSLTKRTPRSPNCRGNRPSPLRRPGSAPTTRFEKAPKKDPLKQIMRSYFPIEEEKDNRVCGAIRGNELRAISHRMPDLARSGDGTGRCGPLVEWSPDVAREPYCVSSPADVSVMVPDSLSFCGLNHASSRKEATSPRLPRRRLGAGWTESRMDDTVHAVVSPVDTDVSDLWSLR